MNYFWFTDKGRYSIVVFGLVWSGLVWSGLVQSGLVWSGLVWSVVNEEQAKEESLNHYRINMDTANPKVLQEQPHNNHKVGSLEKQCNVAMQNYSAPSNLEHEQP